MNYREDTLTDFGSVFLLAFVFVFVRPTVIMWVGVEHRRMPTVELDEETIQRLDSLREESESYDELVTELINIYEAEELTLFHGGDEY